MNPLRTSIMPEADDTWASIALRAFPDVDPEVGIQQLQSWNLHIFARRTIGENDEPSNPILPSDIVFLEPPAPKRSAD